MQTLKTQYLGNEIPTLGAKVLFLKSVASADNKPGGIEKDDVGVLLTTNREGHWGVYVEGKRLIDVEDASAFQVLGDDMKADVVITKQ